MFAFLILHQHLPYFLFFFVFPIYPWFPRFNISSSIETLIFMFLPEKSCFSYAADSANSRTIITENDIERFARIWVKLADKKKTGTIPMHCIYQLMYRIGAPLGIQHTCTLIHAFSLIALVHTHTHTHTHTHGKKDHSFQQSFKQYSHAQVCTATSKI
jgi:hypothetical protein